MYVTKNTWYQPQAPAHESQWKQVDKIHWASLYFLIVQSINI